MLLILLMAFITRACGAAWNRVQQLEIVFAAPFGYAAYQSSGMWWIGLVGWFTAYFGMQLGHGRFYVMHGANLNDQNPELIERLIEPIFTKRGWKLYNPSYSWACMGMKGLIIGLAAFPFGLALAVLWPLAYYIGFKIQKNESALAEWIAGAFAGLILWMSQ